MPLKNLLPKSSPFARLRFRVACASLLLPALLAAQTALPVVNPSFADADKNGQPDGWTVFPGANGTTRVVAPDPEGGFRITDQDKGAGLGLVQWLPVEQGVKYRASLELGGKGGLFVYLVFTSSKPARDGDLRNVTLLEQREWSNAGKASSVAATAPAGAKWVRVWIFSPKTGTTDVVARKITVESLGADPAFVATAAAASAAPAAESPAPAASAPQPAPAAAAAAPAASAGTIAPPPADNLLQNPLLVDADGNGQPDSWSAFPGPNGTTRALSADPSGGFKVVDQDKGGGVGFVQWVPAQPGVKYTASAEVSGQGGLFLYLIFTGGKPARDGDLSKVTLLEQREWAAADKPASVAAVAPAEAKWIRVWAFSPKTNTTEVTVRKIVLQGEGVSPSSLPPPPSDAKGAAAASSGGAAKPKASKSNATPGWMTAPITPPPGLHALMDFETGDYTQANAKEGGKHAVITAAEGPVREGKYAFQAALVKPNYRTEIGCFRCPPSGIARYGWSIYVPQDYDATKGFSIITQWHDYGSGNDIYTEDGAAPTHLYIAGGKWRFKLRHQGDNMNMVGEQFIIGPMDDARGKWTDWVLEVNWQGPGKDGWMKLYKNEKQVVDYKGATWYDNTKSGPYFKMGIYKGKTKNWPSEEAHTILYFDAFRMALGEKSTFKDVSPSAYAPRP